MAADRRASAYLEEAATHMAAGRHGQAFSALRQLLALDPTHVEGRRLFATVLLKLGNLLTAKSAFDSLIQEALQARQYARAESLLREYLAVNPKYVPFLEVLGSVYEAMNDRLSAALEYGRAVDALLAEPDHARPQHARELYDRIVKLAPDSLVAARLAAPMSGGAPVSAPAELLSEPLMAAAPAPIDDEPPAAMMEAPAPGGPASLQDTREEALDLPSEPARTVADGSGFRFATRPPDEAAISQDVVEPPPVEMSDSLAEAFEPAVAHTPSRPDEALDVLEASPPAAPLEPPAPPAPMETAVRERFADAAAMTTMDPPPATLDAPFTPVEPSAAPQSPPAVAMTIAADPMPAAEPKAVPRQPSKASAPYKPSRRRTGRTRPIVTRLAAGMARLGAVSWSLVRTVALLAGAVGGLLILAVVLVAASWVAMEQRPSPMYAEFTGVSAPRTLDDPRKNGYFLLLGFAAPATADPVRAGHERWRVQTGPDPDCYDEPGEVTDWFKTPDPVARAQGAAARLRERLTADAVWQGRYRRWLGLPFEDWGYGVQVGVACPRMLTAHRLYVFEGFATDLIDGLDRLEADIGAWRAVLAHAKTLSLKLFAAEAISDDATLLSGLLARPEVDARVLGRASRLGVPLTADERSLRWAMQHELLLKRQSLEPRPQATADGLHPALGAVVERLPLPKQAVLNGYASYYEALIKFSQSRSSTPPRLYEYVGTPPARWTDYVRNPIDNVLGAMPMPDWDLQRRILLETDARLRLAGLQARLRASSAEPSLVARIANAGSSYFDPFTEFTMLVNQANGRLYSVGRDGRDDRGDPARDVSVPLMLPR